MNINFNDKNTQIIKKLTLEAERFGVKIYFVGGLVRDAIMGNPINDIDILIEGSAIDFVKSLSNVEIKSLHSDFNTAKTVIDGAGIDFASTRKEVYPHSGCLPVVTQAGCPVNEDLIRRDFSINAIAAQILPEGGYKIIDVFNGVEDISTKTLRVLHDKSFIDDPTRILRGLDFKLRFNFDFDNHTKVLIDDYLSAPDREYLSTDRVILTLKKLFKSNPREAFRQIVQNKYYKILFDEEKLNVSDIEEAVNIFSPLNIADVYLKYMIESKPSLPDFLSAIDIYKYFKNFCNEDLCVMWAYTKDKNLLKYFREYKNIKVNIGGADLIKLGFSEGKIIGAILDKVLEKKLENPDIFKDLSDEIDFVKNNFIL